MSSHQTWAPAPSGCITIHKCDHLGNVQISYPGQVVYGQDDCIVARCIWRLHQSYRQGTFSITDGDILIETYYGDRWYNIFAVYAHTGFLKGWYCNVTYPTIIQQNSLYWHDLALDLLVLPDGSQRILDEHEFADLNIADSDRALALAALGQLQALAESTDWPMRRDA